MIADLTPRELEAAELAAQSLSTAEIGEMMGVSARTAKEHLDKVRRKLGVGHKRHIGRALRAHDGKEG